MDAHFVAGAGRLPSFPGLIPFPLCLASPESGAAPDGATSRKDLSRLKGARPLPTGHLAAGTDRIIAARQCMASIGPHFWKGAGGETYQR